MTRVYAQLNIIATMFFLKIIKRNIVLQFISALGVLYCVLSVVTRH